MCPASCDVVVVVTGGATVVTTATVAQPQVTAWLSYVHSQAVAYKQRLVQVGKLEHILGIERDISIYLVGSEAPLTLP